MNIKQAKEQIRNTLRAYLDRDALGAYRIPAVRQRPVLLIGPPGIGKTQIMEQIAAEENVGLVSYTITHHTRQSAIGLPFIEKRVYGGEVIRFWLLLQNEWKLLKKLASLKKKAAGLLWMPTVKPRN